MPTAPRLEHVYYDPPTPVPAEPWWTRYAAQLVTLSQTARLALEADCRFILERGVLQADAQDSTPWPSSRVRTGLVMGSVQSGKTASMLGVCALSIDHGIDVVVVLAGTRLSLWRQTYERLVAQLDPGEEDVAKINRRLLCPAPRVGLADEPVTLSDTYRISPPELRRKLKRGKPLIVVAMKQADHLHALGLSLRNNAFDAVAQFDRPVHMLVLDDEADDGSILDAVVEASEDPVFGNLKQIPRAIANLWDPPQGSPSNLRTTYIAYTATPQANLLQEGHNPLAPRDFLVCLRTPLDIGHMIDAANPGNLKAPRSSTYPEPAGLPTFYTGGEVFYRRGVPARLCRPLGPGPGDDRADAVRAFLVAGAIRLLRSGRVGPATATAMAFGSAREAERTVTAPHSMLYHPSASIQDHFTSAEDLLMWAGVPDRQAARQLLASGNATLPDALAKAVVTHPAPWAAWLDRYQASARVIETEFNVVHPSTFPDWPTLQILLTEEIIPGTRVSVVNSDPAADDRPSYRAVLDPASGSWRAPRDLCTIFVSGNVMARGLTLEGMTTALFQRSSNAPLADTQMQMQRWFGYRGSYIELCRVFASADQLALFSAYHDIDEAIRSAIIERMTGGAPEPAVLQGTDFIATGKIANIGNYPLSPGGRPFVRLVNDGASPDSNLAVVADLFGSRPSTAVAEGSRQLGRILTEPLTLLEAADWLDKFRYADYAPGDQGDLAKHWAQVETRLSAEAPLAEPGLYRPPVRGAAGDPARRISPYSIAAYLRLWAACLERPVRGLFVTGEPGRLWSMSDLQAKLVSQPRFWVGIRFGKGHVIQLGDPAFDVMTTVKTIADGELTTDWGTSTPTAGPGQYRADIYFDYYHRNEPTPVAPGDSTWRPAGSDGQILVYVNQTTQAHPAVAVGVCLPAGGPEQFAATRATVTLP